MRYVPMFGSCRFCPLRFSVSVGETKKSDGETKTSNEKGEDIQKGEDVKEGNLKDQDVNGEEKKGG